MLTMLRDLNAHNGHANAAMLNAIRQRGAAVADTELCDLLHHILLANRFWLLTLLGQPFVVDTESRPSASFDELIQRYAHTHEQQSAWLAAATEADLARILESEFIPGGRCSIAQALTQVCLHSHGHRAQCAKLLRRHGGTPPAMDFIFWLAGRPAADWGVPVSAGTAPAHDAL
ncbi:MAG: DinB family protein [Acidobacteria bacterium]|nr:DinB family protein [Acidobacteriota bacterium]